MCAYIYTLLRMKTLLVYIYIYIFGWHVIKEAMVYSSVLEMGKKAQISVI